MLYSYVNVKSLQIKSILQSEVPVNILGNLLEQFGCIYVVCKATIYRTSNS